MPRSTHRHNHPHKQHIPTHARRKPRKAGAGFALVIFFGLLGAGIAFFATDASRLWSIVGAVIGGVTGYLFGRGGYKQ